MSAYGRIHAEEFQTQEAKLLSKMLASLSRSRPVSNQPAPAKPSAEQPMSKTRKLINKDTSRGKTLDLLREAAKNTSRLDAKFIVDDRTLICHRMTCQQAEDIPEKNQILLFNVPYNRNIAFCCGCFSRTPEEQDLKNYLLRVKPQSRNEIISGAIRSYCEQLGLAAEVKNGAVYITTVSGEWFFTINDRPITLHHKNNEQWYDAQGNPQKAVYHIQDTTFSSPAHAISYIAIHDEPERTLPLANKIYNQMVTQRNLAAVKSKMK